MKKENDEMAGPLGLLIGICLVVFLNPFMVSAVGVALPTIGNYFQIGPTKLGLIETSFLAGTVIALLPFGKLADNVGLSKLFFIGASSFTSLTLILALIKNYEAFVIVRFLQGLTASMIIASGMALLTASFPKRIRGRVIGIHIASVYSGLSMGPLVGGFLTDHYGYQSIFIVGGIFGIIAIISIFRFISYITPQETSKFNMKGSIIFTSSTLTIWLGSTIMKHSYIIGTVILAIGITVFVAFLIQQKNESNPIIEVNLIMSNSSFTLGSIVCYLNYTSFTAIIFIFSLYLQYIKELSPTMAGVVLLIQPAIMALLAPVSGWLSDKIRPEKLTTLGMLCGLTGLIIATTIDQTSSFVTIYSLLSFFGLGFALFSSSNANQIMSSITSKYYGVAASTIGTMRTLGILSSISITSAMFFVNIGDNKFTTELSLKFLQGIHTSFNIFIVISIIGIILTLKLNYMSKKVS